MTTIALCDPGDLSCQPGWREACAAVHQLDPRLSVLMQHGRRQATVGYYDQPVPGGPLTRVVVSVVDIVTDLERFVDGMRAALALNAHLIAAGKAAVCPDCGGGGRVFRETWSYEQVLPGHEVAVGDVLEAYCACPQGVAAAARDDEDVIARAGGEPMPVPAHAF